MIEEALEQVGERENFPGTYEEWLTALLIYILDKLGIAHKDGIIFY